MLMRKRGLFGSFFGRHANHTHTLSKSAGNHLDIGGGGAVIPVLPLVPAVRQSVAHSHQTDGIQVTWDRDMVLTGDVTSQINVIINGGAPITPSSVEFHPHHPSVMAIVLPLLLAHGDVITWAYTSGAFKIQELASPNTEADNQTYGVRNDVDLSAFTTGLSPAFD